MKLRPYQEEFIDAVHHAFDEGHRRVLGVAATGAGKTIIASELMRRERGNCLFLADAQELVNQNADKFHQVTGESVGVEMGKQESSPSDRVIVATSQSLFRRVEKFEPDHFNLIIVDECFPAGTLIDGKPIEDFKVGDPITAFDEITGRLEQSVVTDVMQKQASELVEIKSGEYSITCTPNHPIWTQRGWQPAALVDKNDLVLTTETHEKTKKPSNGNLRGLWNQISSYFFAGSQSEIQTRLGLDLLTKVPKQTLLRTSKNPESDVRQGNSRKGIHQTSSNGMGTERKGWKWETLTAGATTDRLHAWMGNGSCNQDKDAARQRISPLLQGGHRESRVEDRYRNRRQFTSHRNRKTTRHKEGRVLKWNRVESVAIFEGGSSKFTESSGGSCNVYNLSVAKYHTYIANGIVVHNCHRNTLGKMSERVLEYFGDYARVLGVTATPSRSDRKCLSDFYEKIAVDIGMKRLIQEKYLSNILIKNVPVEADLSQVSMSGGDYSTSDLGVAIEPILKEAANIIRDHAPDRKKIVVFLPLIKTSLRMKRILNEMGIKAVHVSGEDKSEMDEFVKGDARVICNAQLLTTGWDCPDVDCIMVLRPTKSNALYCLDEDTEILTRDGFLKESDFYRNPIRSVAVFDPETGRISYEDNLGVIHRDVSDNETWISIQGQSSDIRVTNNHTLLYDNKRRKGWKKKTAEYVAQLSDGAYLPVAGNASFPGVPLSDDELRFIGWVMTDGSINKTNGQIQISQGEHQQWCGDIEKMLKGCGFKFGKRVDWRGGTRFKQNSKSVTWTISKGKPRGRDKHLRGWGSLEKWLSKDMSISLMQMTREQFSVMLHAIHLGDGAKQLGQSWTRRSYHIHTANLLFAERLQEMAITRGWRASISKGNWNRNPIYTIHLKDQDFIKVGSTHGNHATWKKEPGKGRCWCVETPSGTIVTRRNGKVTIMGNCQMIGRGTRVSEGKDNLLLLDPLYLSEDHRLMTPARLLAKTDEEAEAMRKHIEEEGGGDLLEIEQDVEEQRAKVIRDRLEQNRKKGVRTVGILEFAAATDQLMEVAEFEPEFGWERQAPSEKQIEVLHKAGFDTSAIETRGQASKILDLLFVRRKKGLATPKQLRMLKKFGHPDPASATFEEASDWLDVKFASFKQKQGGGRMARGEGGGSLPTSLLIRLRQAGLKPKDYFGDPARANRDLEALS